MRVKHLDLLGCTVCTGRSCNCGLVVVQSALRDRCCGGGPGLYETIVVEVWPTWSGPGVLVIDSMYDNVIGLFTWCVLAPGDSGHYSNEWRKS